MRRDLLGPTAPAITSATRWRCAARGCRWLSRSDERWRARPAA